MAQSFTFEYRGLKGESVSLLFRLEIPDLQALGADKASGTLLSEALALYIKSEPDAAKRQELISLFPLNAQVFLHQ